MASKYEEICQDNERRYGTDIGRIGHMLLADRYDDRTHFIYELLQNAEDALKRRECADVRRTVSFSLKPGQLSISHFGAPFSEADVRGVCGIAESTKFGASIGRFGIGFKSVYTFTDRPEIHSGEEDFSVHSYVLPQQAKPVERNIDETLIVLPLRHDDLDAEQEIVDGLARLGPSSLLFLDEIEEINWTASDGTEGFYQRSPAEHLANNVDRIVVIGQKGEEPEIDQTWLVFREDVFSDEQEKQGRVELAFQINGSDDSVADWSIVPVSRSPLVVFFPTVVETELGFLIQGPYKTTPSRDNINRSDPWNVYLIEQTAQLLNKALRWLRDANMLDVAALRSLPLDSGKFSEDSLFEPLFRSVKQAFEDEPLLPCSDQNYTSARTAKLARTQDLRNLLNPKQMSELFEQDEAFWLTAEITQDRAPEIRQYVMRQLGVPEITPESVVSALDKEFLEAQSEEWIAELYEFLSGQPALRKRLDGVPLVRLDNGKQVFAMLHGEPQAFLPSENETGFPTVSKVVSASDEARALLASLGVTEPDLVDDVILNVLQQKYRGDEVDVEDDEYAKDIERILQAFNAEAATYRQKRKFLSALEETNFVMIFDAGNGEKYVGSPTNILLATDRIKRLFSGVEGILIVDDDYGCLRGEPIRELLEQCGALRYPRPIKIGNKLSEDERFELRRTAGHEETSGIKDEVNDWEVLGLEGVIDLLPSLSPEDRKERARLLWESLSDLEERRGKGVFKGTYSWTHYGSYKTEFPSSFLRLLNHSAWVPDEEGNLHCPKDVLFEGLGWSSEPFLEGKIHFKPPIINQLAQQVGIDADALDVLRTCGITTAEELRARLGILDDEEQKSSAEEVSLTQFGVSEPEEADVYSENEDLYGDGMPDIPAGTFESDYDDVESVGGYRNPNVQKPGTVINNVGGGKSSTLGRGSSKSGQGMGGSTSRSNGGSRTFFSYVGAHPADEQTDPDGISHEDRMKVEELSLTKILELEPQLKPTSAGNPGFDLFEPDEDGNPIRWIEVKSMTSSLSNRQVGLSAAQFEMARKQGDSYWLYIVEFSADPERSRLLRIQNPAGLTRTFTFDKGWEQVADTVVLS